MTQDEQDKANCTRCREKLATKYGEMGVKAVVIDIESFLRTVDPDGWEDLIRTRLKNGVLAGADFDLLEELTQLARSHWQNEIPHAFRAAAYALVEARK